MRVRIWLPLAVASLACGVAQAMDKAGNYATYGLTCEELNVAIDKEDTVGMFRAYDWMEGYLTGYNYAKEDNYSLIPEETTDAAFDLMVRYCNKNPTDDLAGAGQALVKAYSAKRLTVAPPQ